MAECRQASFAGHFLWMQGLGVQQAAFAVAETPPFDRSYKCFTFWYYMYGSGNGELAVYVNTVEKTSKILEITGM